MLFLLIMYADVVRKKLDGKEFGLRLVQLKELKVVNGGDEGVNRKAVENSKVDLLLNPHLVKRKDGMFFRRSGLNHIMCKLAHKNKVVIGFSFGAMKTDEQLGRVKQNVRLCNKYNVKVVLVSLASSKSELRHVKDIEGLAAILGLQLRESFKKK